MSARSVVTGLYRTRRRTVYGTLGATLAAGVAGAAAVRSWFAVVIALIAIMAMLIGIALEVRRTQLMLRQMPPRIKGVRRRVATLERTQVQAIEFKRARARIAELERVQTRLVVDLYDRLRSVDPAATPPVEVAPAVGRALIDRGEILDAHAALERAGAVRKLDLAHLRKLRGGLRRRGYLAKALEVARVCADVGTEDDRSALAVIDGQVRVLGGAFTPTVAPQPPAVEPVPNRILHVVGKSLPHTQVGYTLRTQYTAASQRAAGLDPHVVTQMSVGCDGDGPSVADVDGIPHHRIPGPSAARMPLDRWLQEHVDKVAALVQELRPAVLHAASDYLNALTAQVVGDAFGIPVVYESRGFWEETWLSRQAQQYGWDPDRLAEAHGLPDEYRWRREIEDRCRRDADQVVTLAEVMVERIVAGGVPRSRVRVVPNAVDVAAFPVQRRNEDLAARLDISADCTVIGYISSLTEYEGIDTLVRAYAAVRASAPAPVALLVVGDGAERQRLQREAAALGLDDAIFTGRVPHDEVLDYYSVIDIFVVPRRPVEVCHLVTPLKPFEAFATGRTVVLSDVRALAGIAAQSGAAELFEAGDELSLAAVLTGLLKDPQRRRELAEAGAAWVRANRSWTANARIYQAIYREITADEAVIRRLRADRIDAPRLRARLAGRPPIPLETLTSADSASTADEVMTVGWSHRNHPAVALDLPVDWTTLCTGNRSWNFELHAWEFLAPVLAAHARTGERRYLDWCVDRAVSWAQTFNEGDDRGTMAWYDMALGLRGHRLAYLVEQAVLHDAAPERLAVLLACVVRHQREFFADRAFNAGNNHGVYTALGQLALARRLCDLPGMQVLQAQGRERLAAMTSSQFGADGGHLEHSPEYHRMVLAAFRGALEAGLLDADGEVRRRIELAAEVLPWLVQPNGELAQVGDSPATRMPAVLPTGGRLKVLPDTGYAVVRSPLPEAGGNAARDSYLFLTAAFHSRVHKHADDLSITWYDQGREILIDAGRYGYVDPLPKDSPLRRLGFYYSAPERRYVESTRAHNTVEADGLDHARRGRAPYGSAITDGAERDGCFLLTAEVDHGAWRHHRRIVFRPGRWLQVTDRLTAQDDGPHDYRVWWNFPAEATLRPDGPAGLALDLPGCPEPLWVVEWGGSALIEPVTAQRDPLRGWRSKADLQFTPAWSTGFATLGARNHEFRTVFSFGPRPSAPPADPFR